MIDNIFNIILEMFGYTFVVRAFTVGILVSLCASLFGVSLVMKRFSMIRDGLSHVGFGPLAAATAMNAAPLAVPIPIVITAVFLLLRLSENRWSKNGNIQYAYRFFDTSLPILIPQRSKPNE